MSYQEASYPLSVNLLSKDFDYANCEVSFDSKVKEPLNEGSGSTETSEGI